MRDAPGAWRAAAPRPGSGRRGGRQVEADGKPLCPLYDCAKNAWFGAALAGADPVGTGKFNNSMGLMYDSGRKLVWAVGQNGHVFVLRFDAKQARLHPLR